MSENRGQSERFLTDLIRAFYDDVEDDRLSMFEAACYYCDDDKPEVAWARWCDYMDLNPAVGAVLSRRGDIMTILSNLIVEQEELDKEATVEYHEKQQAYRELQGC